MRSTDSDYINENCCKLLEIDVIWVAEVHVDELVHNHHNPEAMMAGCNLLEAKSAKDPSMQAAKETEKTEKPAATKPAMQAQTQGFNFQEAAKLISKRHQAVLDQYERQKQTGGNDIRVVDLNSDRPAGEAAKPV
eukprot:s2523_g4.t1